MEASEILGGPRGRRFVAEALLRARRIERPDEAQEWPWWSQDVTWQLRPWDAEASAAPTHTPRPELGPWVAEVSLESLRTLPSESVLGVIADVTGAAMYWQPPHPEDVFLANDDVVPLLLPAAQALLENPAVAALDGPLLSAPDELRALAAHLNWFDEQFPDLRNLPHLPRRDADGTDKLERWREATLADDSRARVDRPSDVNAPFTGVWWSAPAMARLATTAGWVRHDDAPEAGSAGLMSAAPGGMPGYPITAWCLGLDSIEDRSGWTRGTVTLFDLIPAATPKVFEVDGPAAWAELVTRFPLNVTSARRHDWFKVTGLDVPWFIPDWRQVAEEYDAVHVSLGGYLAAATRTLPLGSAGPVAGAHTMLAGWDPDQTYWFGAPLVEVDQFEVAFYDPSKYPFGPSPEPPAGWVESKDPYMTGAWMRAADESGGLT